MTHQLFNLLNFFIRTFQRLLGISSVGVKALVINPQNEILLVKHTYIDGWHLPGGGLKKKETPSDAIIRELIEEASVVVKKDPHLFAVYTHQIHGADDYPILFIVKDFESTPFAGSIEIAEAKWFSLQNLPAGTTPSTHARIQEYFSQQPPNKTW